MVIAFVINDNLTLSGWRDVSTPHKYISCVLYIGGGLEQDKAFD